jgi:ketosteroid isomerase-like protein
MSTQVSVNQDPIFALRQAFHEACKAGDIESIVSFATDDVIAMPPNDTTIYGRAEWKQWWEDYHQYFRIAAVSESDREVTIHGDFALERSGYMLAVVPASGGGRIRDDGRFFTIWKRQLDGSWKMWQLMWNSSKPVGIGTNRYLSRMKQKKTGDKR